MSNEETRQFLVTCQQHYQQIAQRHHGLCADTAAHYERAIAILDREEERRQRRRENIRNGLLLLAVVAIFAAGMYTNILWPLA